MVARFIEAGKQAGEGRCKNREAGGGGVVAQTERE
jgi:hypothetical protein